MSKYIKILYYKKKNWIYLNHKYIIIYMWIIWKYFIKTSLSTAWSVVYYSYTLLTIHDLGLQSFFLFLLSRGTLLKYPTVSQYSVNKN